VAQNKMKWARIKEEIFGALKLVIFFSVGVSEFLIITAMFFYCPYL